MSVVTRLQLRPTYDAIGGDQIWKFDTDAFICFLTIATLAAALPQMFLVFYLEATTSCRRILVFMAMTITI